MNIKRKSPIWYISLRKPTLNCAHKKTWYKSFRKLNHLGRSYEQSASTMNACVKRKKLQVWILRFLHIFFGTSRWIKETYCRQLSIMTWMDEILDMPEWIYMLCEYAKMALCVWILLGCLKKQQSTNDNDSSSPKLPGVFPWDFTIYRLDNRTIIVQNIAFLLILHVPHIKWLFISRRSIRFRIRDETVSSLSY